ncbi:hypothetical protein FJZ53_07005 [Candidatus Woesearchaeota archaeon]|nr:hypothetical protein [Candidatus Woesearchaeota archaeon]
MGDKVCPGSCDHPKCGSGAIYGIGFLGAVYYYVSTATSFWGGAVGVIKALLWPAFLVYAAMKSLGM